MKCEKLPVFKFFGLLFYTQNTVFFMFFIFVLLPCQAYPSMDAYSYLSCSFIKVYSDSVYFSGVSFFEIRAGTRGLLSA